MLGLQRRGVWINPHTADRVYGGLGWIAVRRVRIFHAVGIMGVIMGGMIALRVLGMINHHRVLECLGK